MFIYKLSNEILLAQTNQYHPIVNTIVENLAENVQPELHTLRENTKPTLSRVAT